VRRSRPPRCAIARRERRAGRAARSLVAALALVGAVAPTSARAQGAVPIRVDTPRSGSLIAAQRIDHRRLTAAVELAGAAQPGAQLALVASCGRVDCSALTYADDAGRWRTRMALTTPRGRHDVRVRMSYWPAPPGRAPVATRLKLRVSAPVSLPPEVPQAGKLAPGGAPALVMIGDSLAMGVAQPLTLDLPGWAVRFDARIGRPLAEGMDVLAAGALPAQRGPARTVLAFSLYTNDPPTDVDQLEAAVRASLARLGPRDCAIWATISRPAVHGVSYRAANERLLALAADPLLAGRLVVVPWADEVGAHRGWKASDHVHATAAGYLARARMYADAALACSA
jgi:hypothetical protein